MKLMNRAVDEVRRQEQKANPELNGNKYLWLKNEWNHKARQKELFDAVLAGIAPAGIEPETPLEGDLAAEMEATPEPEAAPDPPAPAKKKKR